jgi:hypothetical protein
LKTEDEKKRYKARLVAKGYLQQLGFDYKQTYAPVANIITIRTLLCVINQKNLYICQLDVKTAFLNEQLDEEIYMEQPQGFVENSSLVCKLQKAIYGLKQAPKYWNRRFDTFITSQGFIRSESDNCLYIRGDKFVCTYLLLYVNDILLAGKKNIVPIIFIGILTRELLTT